MRLERQEDVHLLVEQRRSERNEEVDETNLYGAKHRIDLRPRRVALQEPLKDSRLAEGTLDAGDARRVNVWVAVLVFVLAGDGGGEEQENPGIFRGSKGERRVKVSGACERM